VFCGWWKDRSTEAVEFILEEGEPIVTEEM